MPTQVRNLAEKYFGGWRQEVLQSVAPSATEALARPTQGALELEQAARAGPAVMQAFYRPSVASADAPIFDVIRCHCLWYQAYIAGRERMYRGQAPLLVCISSYGCQHRV